jgi:hypothetical protein
MEEVKRRKGRMEEGKRGSREGRKLRRKEEEKEEYRMT